MISPPGAISKVQKSCILIFRNHCILIFRFYGIVIFRLHNEHVLPDGYVQTQTAEDSFVKNHYYKKSGKPLKTAVNIKNAMLEKIELITSSIKKGMEKPINNDDNW